MKTLCDLTEEDLFEEHQMMTLDIEVFPHVASDDVSPFDILLAREEYEQYHRPESEAERAPEDDLAEKSVTHYDETVLRYLSGETQKHSSLS